MIQVNVLFILDAAQTVISTHFGWFFIIATWGNPADFSIVPWSASMIPILCGIVTAMVQMFYAWRIWVLAPNNFLKATAVLIVVLAFTQGTAAIVAGGLVLHIPTQGELARVHPEVTLWLSTSFTVDVIITASMTFILTRAKQKSAWSPTETMLTALIHRVVQTGAASAICAAIDLAMFVGYPATNNHFAPAYILGKVYTNSLMLTLNLRRPTAATSRNHSRTESGVASFRMDENRVRVTRALDMEASPAGVWNQKGTNEYVPNNGGFGA
ncbi:hypothetical protein B0H17DRAFT_1183869 [Mycena rosella]|uniref:DUF6534 domain-containing protein n=1 Tax=Mycena rosella TaxID=1033263 RepID=A0AAD7G9C2_MYCRO|nr:hypothetical protein B0H17DRAFT_1183869 [Mycena rosella]